jgi:hypothetical protein
MPDLTADVVGELAPTGITPDSIPLSSAVTEADLAALKDGDADVVQLVAKLSPGRGGRGWEYTPEAIAAFASHVQEKSLNGYLGHLTDEELKTKFPTPVVAWIGAKMVGDTAYIRGVVDRSAADVKRWLRARRITAPSVFTRPKLTTHGGTRYVTGFEEILSLDLAPLGRQGMNSAEIVYAGETRSATPGGDTSMNLSDLCADLDMPSTSSEAEVRARIRAAWSRAKLNLAADVSTVAGEMGVPEHLRGLVTSHVVSRLHDAGAEQGEIRGLIGSMQSTAEYKAALGNNTVGLTTTIHGSAPRPHQGGDPLGGVFDLQPYTITAA